jgi:hypothetical protein
LGIGDSYSRLGFSSELGGAYSNGSWVLPVKTTVFSYTGTGTFFNPVRITGTEYGSSAERVVLNYVLPLTAHLHLYAFGQRTPFLVSAVATYYHTVGFNWGSWDSWSGHLYEYGLEARGPLLGIKAVLYSTRIEGGVFSDKKEFGEGEAKSEVVTKLTEAPPFADQGVRVMMEVHLGLFTGNGHIIGGFIPWLKLR